MKPDWHALYETASPQEGFFTAAQAAAAGFSPQLLSHHLRRRRIRRMRRGIYRLSHFPEGEHEDLVVLWLWSSRQGVFSHETALFLQGLSDAMPARIHLSLPTSWRSRRLRVPSGVVLTHADVADEDRTWVACLPVTNAARTLDDCLATATPPEIIAQALDEASHRGLIDRRTATGIRRRLREKDP